MDRVTEVDNKPQSHLCNAPSWSLGDPADVLQKGTQPTSAQPPISGLTPLPPPLLSPMVSLFPSMVGTSKRDPQKALSFQPSLLENPQAGALASQLKAKDMQESG